MRGCWLLVATLCWATAAQAGLLDDVAERLNPIKATVLTDKGGEILLDVGSNNGVVPSDLFAVGGKGEKIVHPQTGAILGEVPIAKGVVQVTWVKENFCGAKRVRGKEALTPGDMATRYGELDARLLGCAPGGEGMLADLRQKLPQLRWQDYRPASATECAAPPTGSSDLLFVDTDRELLVRDGGGALLHRFALPAVVPVANAAAPVVAGAAIGNAPFRERWYAGDWEGRPAAVAVADFDGDKAQEIVVAASRRIVVGRSVERKWQPLSAIEVPVSHQILALEAFDIDGDGTPELCVSAARDADLSSFVYRLQKGALVEVQKGLPWLLRAVTTAASGERFLSGQERGEKSWAGKAVRLQWQDGKLRAGEKLDLPDGTGLRGMAYLASDKGAALVRLNSFDNLQILDANGDKLWKSDLNYGGSETFIEIPDGIGKTNDYATRNLYVQQRLEALGANRVLVPVNIGSRTFNRLISYDESQMQLLEWDGRALHTIWETAKEKGYLADYLWADLDNDGSAELAMLVAYSKGGLLSKGQFSLTVLEP
jgi:hypothetical protein